MTEAPETSPVQRIFLGWDGPALPRAAKVMAEEYAGPEGLDLRDVVVVTPAARAGRRLAELLLDEAGARKAPLTPPTTVTMGRFPELLYRPTGRIADSTGTRHAFTRALRSVDPEHLKEVFPHPPLNLAGWMALAGVVGTLHRELGAAGLDFEDVARRFPLTLGQREGPSASLSFDDSSRWKALARVQQAYFEILEESGLRDRDRERRAAFDEKRLASPGDVWLVGVAELPKVVGQMVEALPGPIRALIHAPQELRLCFDSLGCVDPEQWQKVHVPLKDERIRVVQRPRDQAAVTVAVLDGFQGRFAAEEIVVGVPDSELVPFIERGLSGAGVHHRFAGGTPLEHTGPVRFLQALNEYLDGRSYPAFAALIRHPDLHDLVEEAGEGEATGAITFVDIYQSNHLQDTVGAPLPGNDEETHRTRKLVSHLDAAMGLGPLSGSRPISEWMPDILDVLVRVYGREPVDRSNPRVRQMVEALDRIKAAATRLAILPERLDLEVEASDAVALLLAELSGADVSIPPEPEDSAVELLGWLELPLDDAPAVIVTGVNDRILPEAMGADPFLPGSLRSRLGIPDDDARYARDVYLLSALVSSREEVHVVAGRLNNSGDPLRPSRLLFAVPEKEVAARVLRYLGEEEAEPESTAEPIPAKEDASSSVQGRSDFRSPPHDPLPRLESLTRISVTDFKTYLADPYRYALSRVLNLNRLDDSAREMDGGIFGKLAHDVLEEFGWSQEVSSTDAGVVEKKINQLLNQAVRVRFGTRPVPAVRVQTEQLRVRLRRFAQWQAGWIEDGWQVVRVEQKVETEVSFMGSTEPVTLSGKIDRIDHNPVTGEWAIFDYKTGDQAANPDKTHRTGRGQEKEWIDLQLPLYRFLLEKVLGDDGKPVVPESARKDVKLGYILLPRNLDEVGPAFPEPEWTEDDLAEAEKTALGVVRDLRTREFRFDPEIRSWRGDPLDALLGRLELARVDEGNDGEGEGSG